MRPHTTGQSRRLAAVQAPVIPIVADLISKHPGTISLGQGVVHYAPPPQAAGQIERFFADPDNHKYRPVEGIAPLREALRRKLARENGIATGEHSHVVVTAGGNMAFMNAVLAIADPGDEIILLTPYYFNHEMAVGMAGCRAVTVDTTESYQLAPDAIRAAITPRTRAVVTISPNNPTGAVYPEADLRAVNAICREHGVFHIHDEAYEYFTWDNARHFSPGSIAGAAAHTISLFSLSKAYGFAGWRIGYMVIPSQLREAVRKIQDTILICPPVISQVAALGALEAGAAYCRGHLRGIGEVRQLLLEALTGLGEACAVGPAAGALYFMLTVRSSLTAMQAVQRLITGHGVAVIPGTTFGLRQGCHLRVSYGALQKDAAAEGIARLARGLRSMI
jgi:aspartate/methionine/tyrosine aminotransferase